MQYLQSNEDADGDSGGEEEEENLFILSVTLSNNQTYLVEVKKNLDARQLAERFCAEHGMQSDVIIKRELTALLN